MRIQPNAMQVARDAMSTGCKHMTLGTAHVEVVDSASSRWLLDRGNHRFLRLPKAFPIGPTLLAVPWSPCSRIEDDCRGGTFVIYLDAAGRSRLRFHEDAAGSDSRSIATTVEQAA